MKVRGFHYNIYIFIDRKVFTFLLNVAYNNYSECIMRLKYIIDIIFKLSELC